MVDIQLTTQIDKYIDKLIDKFTNHHHLPILHLLQYLQCLHLPLQQTSPSKIYHNMYCIMNERKSIIDKSIAKENI